MKIVLIQTGKTTEKYVAEGFNNFSGRIGKYISFETVTLPELKNTKNMPVSEQKQREASGQLALVSRDDYLVVLDEAGKEFRTVEFAAKLSELFRGSKKRILFMIGGPWGFSDEVTKRADLRLSLSKLTFSHQLVRLLFAEQLYRALTVIKGDPYHHE